MTKVTGSETSPRPSPSDQHTHPKPEPVSLTRRMGQGAFVMVALTLLASVTNYASNVIFSRILEPASYGDLTALLALGIVLTVPTGAAQTVIAERVAAHAAKGDLGRVRYLVRHALGHVSMIAAAVGILYIAAIPLVEDVLELQAIGPAIALAPLLVLGFFLPVAMGTLQGLDRYLAYGLMLLALAVSRLAFGVPWALSPTGGSGGALAGQAVGAAVVLACAAWLLRSDVLPRGSGAATAGLRRTPDVRAVSAGLAFIAFAVITNLDILLVKLFMSPHDVGMYAVLSTVGKIILFLPAAIAVVLVPNAARARHSAQESARVLRVAAALTVATTAIAALPAALAPELLITTMFGDKYEAASSGVLPMVLAGAGMALLYLLVVYTVAVEDRRWSLVIGVAIALQVVGIALFHDTPAQVATVQAVVVLVALIVNELAFHSLIRRPRSAHT